jgi:uncharacterized protein (DUF1778 family)
MPSTLQRHPPQKTERLEARVPVDLKRMIERAADLQGCSLTDFVIVTLKKTAHDTLREHEVLQLTMEDSRLFAQALISPRKPNTALKKALVDHKKTVQMK